MDQNYENPNPNQNPNQPPYQNQPPQWQGGYQRQPRQAPVNQESQQLLSKVDGTPSPVRLANMAKAVKLKTKSMGEPTLLEVYAKYKEEGNGGPASKLLSYYSAHDEKIMKIVSELEKQWDDVKKEIKQ